MSESLIRCHRCGDTHATLRRVRDDEGKKVKPALYQCYPYCVYKPKPVVLSKDELLAESAAAKAKQESEA